jgi:hypothetical protein
MAWRLASSARWRDGARLSGQRARGLAPLPGVVADPQHALAAGELLLGGRQRLLAPLQIARGIKAKA